MYIWENARLDHQSESVQIEYTRSSFKRIVTLIYTSLMSHWFINVTVVHPNWTSDIIILSSTTRSHFSVPFISGPLLAESCAMQFILPKCPLWKCFTRRPKAECDMQKRAKRAKCGHFSGQFGRCCLWGQKRPRPVCCHLMVAANAFPSNCRVNDGIIGVNVGLFVCVCVAAWA